MNGPEKLAEHSRWLEQHPWWAWGIALWMSLVVLVLAQLLRYGLRAIAEAIQ